MDATNLDPRYARSRTALIEAATELVDARDIASISVSDIVRTANVTRPTFYQHFDGPASLYRVAALRRLEVLLPKLDSIPLHLAEPVDDQLSDAAIDNVRTVAFAFLEHLLDHAPFFRRVYNENGSLELHRDTIQLMTDRLLIHSPLGPFIRRSKGIAPADRALIIAGGLFWMVIDWLNSDFVGKNSCTSMASRLTRSMVALVQ